MAKGKSGDGPKKTSTPAASKPSNVGAADDSHIVFSNAKGDVKPKKPAKTEEKQGESSQDAPKKPDTKTLIAGASWTGKLPVNLFNEHCQKQKWEKPEYTMHRSPDGFSSTVILKAINPKTKETVILPSFRLPPDHAQLAVQHSAVEARHFAAAYALFRVCSMRNIHMMLPPTYRDFFKGIFADLKREDVKEGRGWMYEADPFAAQQERKEAQALMAKQREQRAKDAEKPAQPGMPSASANAEKRNVNRGWANVPSLEMGKKMRRQIEDLVRRYDVWNPNGVRIDPYASRKIMAELVDLGFRKSHAEEAIEACRDREEVLEWLLIHIPEDDLPKWSLPEGYVAGVSMASGNMKRDATIKRLAAAGYALELAETTLEERGEDEAAAAEALQGLLLRSGATSKTSRESHSESPSSSGPVTDSPVQAKTFPKNEALLEDDDTWKVEQGTLEAIFNDRYSSLSPDVCSVQFQVDRSKLDCLLTARRSRSYPRTPPILSVTGRGLPAYIRLSLVRQVVQYCQQSLLEGPMVYNVVDWLESNLSQVVENPGPLKDVAAAASVGEISMPDRRRQKNARRPPPHAINWTAGSDKSLKILAAWQAKQTSPQYQKMLAGRQSLPAWNLREAIVQTVSKHQVTIISGETGSGKSTQSIQFLLDDMIQKKLGSAANIVCTQPRRISALGLASRVSEERCSTLGQEVGYAIRGESKQRQGVTAVTFVTTGVLLRRLQMSGGSQSDVVAALADVSHVVVDEVHERSLDTDFLLVLLRDVLPHRKDLKLILMSATLDANVFQSYFAREASVGALEIQGRTFPVDDLYVDDVLRMTGFNPGPTLGKDAEEAEEGPDVEPSLTAAIQNLGMGINYNLISATVSSIHAQLGSDPGGILIFLPGTLEISHTLDALRSIPSLHALPLHASLPPNEQRLVFPPAPRGRRKVICATNVAETSITIPDIVAVIDSGRVKETSYDPQSSMVRLEEVWASRAACKQRRGRAGRVQKGSCYKLYTRRQESKMAERPEPEIRRVPLEQMCLSVLAMGIQDVARFLSSALTPPEASAIDAALDTLASVGALESGSARGGQHALTELGKHLATIPADLKCAKLLIYGALFDVLDPCLTIASILSVKSPFVSPQAKREESMAARMAFAQGEGDILADLAAVDAWSRRQGSSSSSSYRETRAWCADHFLSAPALQDIASNRTTFLASLIEIGFVPPGTTATSLAATSSSSSPSSHASPALLRALIASALTPSYARIVLPMQKFAAGMAGNIALDPESRAIRYYGADAARAFIHPSSTLFSAQKFLHHAAFMAFFTKVATSKAFMREVSPFGVFALLMFCGGEGGVRIDTLGRGVSVDGWVRVRGWARIGVLVRRLRGMVDVVLGEGVVGAGAGDAGMRAEVLRVARRLIESEGMD